jgi:hypothetical protein
MTNVSWNGVTYSVPSTSEEEWSGSTKVDGLLIALATHGFNKTGGLFTLTADADFGATAGLVSQYYKSRSSNLSTAGVLRLANGDSIGFRNAANDGNLLLSVNGSNQLLFNGVALVTTASVVGVAQGGTNISAYTAGDMLYATSATTLAKLAISTANRVLVSSGSAPSWSLLVDANIDAAAAIALSKLAALTASRALVSSAGGVISVSSVTDTELGYLSGVSSAVQTQLNAKASTASLTAHTGASSGVHGVTGGVVGTSDTQSLSNKTFSDAPVLTQIATPSAPSAGTQKVYPKSDGKLYTLLPSGVEQPVGSAGGGSKNYLTTYKGNTGNGDFELNATTGWSLFNTTLTSLIPTGSISAGAASVGTFNTVSSGQLGGSYSLQTASAAAWSAGQGFISDAFTIDTEDQAKPMQITGYFKVVSGASNGNFSGTSSNTFAVYVYDVTNSAWIQPAGVYSMTQNSGVGYINATFQTSASGTQYRVAIVAVNASAGAMTLYWDDFIVGPQMRPLGPAMTDWQSFAFTLQGSTSNPTLGTTAVKTAFWRRVGDSMEVIYEIKQTSAGTDGTGTYLFPLPSGYSIDTSKLTVNTGDSPYATVGEGTYYCSGTNAYPGIVQPYDTTRLQMTLYGTVSSNGTFGSGFAGLNPGSNLYVGVHAIVPIAGLVFERADVE